MIPPKPSARFGRLIAVVCESAGVTLAGAAESDQDTTPVVAKVVEAPAPAPRIEGLEPVWTVAAPYVSVATGPQGRLAYAIHSAGRCDVVNAEGNLTRTFPLENARAGTDARVARGHGGAEGLFTFRHWGQEVAAFLGDGTKLWEEAGGQGIDDVCAADLDGDGVDEAIVGYNGGTGLHVFSPDGKRLWKRTDLGNVWNVAAGDIDGDGKPEVISTSAHGKVHVSAAADGAVLATLDAGLYANKLRVAPGRAKAPAKGDLILVVGTGFFSRVAHLAALGGDGKVLWTTDLQAGRAACQNLAVSPDGALAAVSFQGGQVVVVDLATGQVVGQVADQGFLASVAWVVRGEGPGANQLLITTQAAINAFRLKPIPDRR